MKLNKIKRGKVTHFYITESFRICGKSSSRTIKKLGTDKEIKEKYNVDDAEAWAIEQVKHANNLKTMRENKDFSKFLGIEYMYKLYQHFGIYDFVSQLEVKEGFKKDELNNLLFVLILDSVYFPNDCYFNYSYFFDGYFNEKDIVLENVYPLYQAITKNIENLLKILQDNNDIDTSANYACFANIELDVNLGLSDNKNIVPYLAILFDASYMPITMLHSFFSDVVNKRNLNRGLDDFGFVDVYSNLDKLSIKPMLPEKASLKGFKRLNLQEAKHITKTDITYDDTWNKFDYQQKSSLKNLTDIFYKTFPVNNNKDYVVVAFYGLVYGITDLEKKINITYSTLDNPIFNSNEKMKIFSYKSQYDFKNNDKGHRFYLAPKTMPFYLVANFDYAYTFLVRKMNSVPFDNKDYINKDVKRDYIVGDQTINYIANLFAAYTIKKSNYYINSIHELGFFLRSLDGASFFEKSKNILNQLIYRLNDLKISSS